MVTYSFKVLELSDAPSEWNLSFYPYQASQAKIQEFFKENATKVCKRPGTSEEIIQQINRVTRGWINYFGLGFIKGFIKEIEGWLHHRLRQLIFKRWKKPRTVIKKLKSYGLDLDSAKRIAFSRKDVLATFKHA